MKVRKEYANQRFGGMNMMTFTRERTCAHNNGRYVTVKCLFNLIKIRRFVCSDCGDVTP